MNLHKLSKVFQNRVPQPEGKYQRFSVLVPIVKVKDELELLFEIRSKNLKTQPGEICFPGGKIEENETALDGAARETVEELNISSTQIEILGPLDYLVTPFNLILYPFLGTICDVNVEDIHFAQDEVSDIFTVPLKYFLENKPLEHIVHINAHIHKDFPFHMVQDGENYRWRTGKYPILFYTYKNHIIWGMTARIIKNLVDLLNEQEFGQNI